MPPCSALAAPGAGYAATENQEKANAGADASANLAQVQPGEQSAIATNLANQGPYQTTIAQAMMNLAPGNIPAEEQAYANEAFSNAARAAQQSGAQAQQSGFSPAYVQGQTTAANNEAANQANSFDAFQNSPENELQMANARLGLYAQSANSPVNSMYQQQLGDVYGQPQAQVGQGIGSALTGLGSLYGAGAFG